MQQAIQLQFGIGLHESLWSQYTSYWSQLFHANLGQSITLSAPVSTVLGETLPWTVGLLGVSTFFQAVPYFFLGTVLLLVFGSDLHWFPVLGNYERGLTPGFHGPSPAGCWACGT